MQTAAERTALICLTLIASLLSSPLASELLKLVADRELQVLGH